MASVKNLWSKITKTGENSSENLSNVDIEFHGHFPVEENSLNGISIKGVYIPEEVLLNIFTYLKPQDILNCSLVCKRWCNIAKSNMLWQAIYNIKEYPNKAKNLPWYVFYCYFATINFKNVLKNGNGQKQFQHWNIICNGGDKFIIEDPPAGSDALPEGISDFNGYTSCFATSYDTCSKYQKIELSTKRLLQYIIKKYKPSLYLSEWYSARFDCACVYMLAVRCDTKGNKWVPRNSEDRMRLNHTRNEPRSKESTTPFYLKSQKDEIQQWAGKEWKKMELITQNYPSDTETVYFCHEGQDCQFWLGHYGSKMAGGVMKFLFESIEPTLEDIGDIEEIM